MDSHQLNHAVVVGDLGWVGEVKSHTLISYVYADYLALG